MIYFDLNKQPELQILMARVIKDKKADREGLIHSIILRRSLGSMFHIERAAQLRIIKEFEMMGLFIKTGRKEYKILVD